MKSKSDNVDWPDTVPCLVTSDIVLNHQDGLGGSHDIGTWLELVFGTEDSIFYKKAYKKLIRVLEQHSGERRKAIWEYCAGDSYSEIYLKNYYTKRFLASCWNICMKELGYELLENACIIPEVLPIPIKVKNKAKAKHKAKLDSIYKRINHCE